MRSLFLFSLAFCAAACTDPAAQRDKDLRAQLIGQWQQEKSWDSGMKAREATELTAEGNRTTEGVISVPGQDGKYRDIQRTVIESRWRLEQGVLTYFDFPYDPKLRESREIQESHEVRYQVVRADAEKLVLKSVEDGELIERTRAGLQGP